MALKFLLQFADGLSTKCKMSVVKSIDYVIVRVCILAVVGIHSLFVSTMWTYGKGGGGLLKFIGRSTHVSAADTTTTSSSSSSVMLLL